MPPPVDQEAEARLVAREVGDIKPSRMRRYTKIIGAAVALLAAVAGACAYVAGINDTSAMTVSTAAATETEDTTIVATDLEAAAPQAPSNKLTTCLFLHGAMVQGARPTKWKTWYGDVAGSLRTYWGPYNIWYADLCSQFVYSWADTKNYNWMDSHLQTTYYEKARDVIASGGIVFAHSMANAILAGACYQQGKCVQWYSLGGGYSGQAIGNAMSNVITVANYVIPVNTFMNDIVFQGFNYFKDGMRLASTNKNKMAQLVDSKSLLKGSVCGIQPLGNPKQLTDSSLRGNVFKLFDFNTAVRVQSEVDQFNMGLAMGLTGNAVADELAKTGHPDKRNDGLVEVASCAYWRENGADGPIHWYGGKGQWPELGATDTLTLDQTHILARVNHIEETGVFSNTPVVMDWMRNMMCREIAAAGGQCPTKSIAYNWPDPTGQTGEACDLFHPCQGNALLGPGNACCTNAGHSMCQTKLSDYIGISWCPSDCQGIIGQSGTCENDITRLHWPRKSDEMCVFGTDCENWTGDLVEKCRAFENPRLTQRIVASHPTGYNLAAALERDGFIRVEAFSSWCVEETRFDALNAFLKNAFGNDSVSVMERQNDFCRFKLEDANENLKLSKVFALVEEMKTKMHIAEYSVSQTTLEQIFNQFAAKQTEEKGVARGMVQDS